MTAARALRFASALTLLALALMVWSLFDPRPVPVMVAMSAGQALGMFSLGIYLVVVLLDLRRRLGGSSRTSESAPPDPPQG